MDSFCKSESSIILYLNCMIQFKKNKTQHASHNIFNVVLSKLQTMYILQHLMLMVANVSLNYTMQLEQKIVEDSNPLLQVFVDNQES